MAVLTWQKRIAEKAPTKNQKAGARSASRALRRAAARANTAAGADGAPGAPPSGASP
jgi:hypothetical protein